MEPEELAEALVRLQSWAYAHQPKRESPVRARLKAHLGEDLAGMEVISHDVTAYDHVNLQVALDALAAGGTELDLLGLGLERGFHVSLAELARSGGQYDEDWAPGPPQYQPVDVGDRTISCLTSGLMFTRHAGEPVAALLAPDEEGPRHGGLHVQAMAPHRPAAEAWLAALRADMQRLNVYRGKVVAFGGDHPFQPAPLTVRPLPEVRRERIVLPEDTLARIERHTAGFARHADALRTGGRHIRRGLLLHGPPGTGKTLSIMYLAGLMPERTVILITGQSLGAIGAAAALARSLAPAMVVVEDVDLIARDRRAYEATPLLFELLNAMDGLDEDADIIFALTTNRPEVLEPALASRPGRIDLAVELPLPDAAARRRLLELYGEGLALSVGDWDPVVAATDGTSPAFIRELLRHAALTAAESGAAAVGTAQLVGAVQELKHDAGRLTAALLGADRPAVPLEDEDDDDEDEDEDGGPGWSPAPAAW